MIVCGPSPSMSHDPLDRYKLGCPPRFCTPRDLVWNWVPLVRHRPPTYSRATSRASTPYSVISITPRPSVTPTPVPIPTPSVSAISFLLTLSPKTFIDSDDSCSEYAETHHVILSIPFRQRRIAAVFKTVRMRVKPRRYTRPPVTFLEEYEDLRDPSVYIENLVIAPGRTPSVAEIMRLGLIGRRKPSAEKLLLPPLRPLDAKKKCLIIDLDETLVHSSFKPVKNPDFVIPVEIDGVVHQVYVLKRPFVDEFLAAVGDKFECVLFTASLAKYADPVADLLDKKGVFRSRLFREACVFHKGNYVKDLARLGRDLNKTLIMDNSPASYAFHPENAIAVQTWFDDPHDVELLDVLPLLDRLATVDSVYTVLRQSESPEPHDRSPS